MENRLTKGTTNQIKNQIFYLNIEDFFINIFFFIHARPIKFYDELIGVILIINTLIGISFLQHYLEHNFAYKTWDEIKMKGIII